MKNFPLTKSTEDKNFDELSHKGGFEQYSIRPNHQTQIKRRIIAKFPPQGWSASERIEALKFADENEPFIRQDNLREELRRNIVALSRLAPDWAGPDSVVPKQKVIDDFQSVLAALPSNMNRPDIEIDDEGGVALEWVRERDHARFALYCCGTGKVVGTYVTLDINDQISWRLSVMERGEIARKLSAPVIATLMTGAL